MNNLHSRITFLFCLFLSFSYSILAQTVPELETSGQETHTLNFTGDVQDFIIPESQSNTIRFYLRGGDGGRVRLGDCESAGGDGAEVQADILIGEGSNKLPVGTKIRFIVGENGVSDNTDVQFAYGAGGGGGGSALLAFIDGQWEIIAVAGGGGGAYQGAAGFCTDSQNGEGGRDGVSGGSGKGEYGGAAGVNGNGGGGGGAIVNGDLSGGGGGAFSNGRGNASREGKAGYPSGGNGGTLGLNSAGNNGGWGFGGGGAGEEAGGGGGGYSGGGGGGVANNGGGGGSYVNPKYAFKSSITAGGSLNPTYSGLAEYIMVSTCSVEFTGTQQYFDYEYIETICNETDKGAIQMLFNIIDGNRSIDPCALELEWRIFPNNDYTYLGNGNWSNVGVGLHLVEVYNTRINAVVASTEIQVRPQNNRPEAKCKDVTVTMGGSFITVEDNVLDNGSTPSICDESISFSLSKKTFSCFDIGDNTVEMTVIGSNGYSSTCEATLTIRPFFAGFVSCREDFEVDLAGRESVSLSQADIETDLIKSNCAQTEEFFGPEKLTCSDFSRQRVFRIELQRQDGTVASSCVTKVTVVDSSRPTARCKEEVTVTLDDKGQASLEGKELDNGSEFNSNCIDLGYFDLSQSEFDCSHIGDNVITLTVTNGYNNTSTCTSNVKVQQLVDNPPNAVCEDLTLDLDINKTATLSADMMAGASTDDCSISNISIEIGLQQYDCSHVGQSFQIDIKVEDNAANASTCSAMVSIADPNTYCNAAPIAVCQDITVSLDASCSVSITPAQVNDGSFDPDGDQLFFSLDESTFTKGVHSVVLTVSDGSTSAQCPAKVTALDVTKPVPDVASLPTITAECFATVDPPTATDACDGTITGITIDPTSFSEQGTYTIQWVFDDASLNTAVQTQTVIIKDVTKPVPDVTSLPIISAECSATVSAKPTATDNCKGSIEGTTSDPLTYSTQGTHFIIWSFDDGNGNVETQTQTVIIKDVTKPVPDVASLPTITVECSTILSIPTATDNCKGTINGTTNDLTNISEQGTYDITWTYDDGNGNVETQTQTVIIKDVSKPVPDLTSLPTLTSQCAVNVSQAPTATDNCAGTIIGTTNDPLSYSSQGTHLITWTFDDGNGNIETQTQTVIIKDVTAPVPDVATLPTIIGNCEAGLEPPFATDNCAGQVIGSTSDPLYFDQVGTYTVTWVFDDGNGNTSSQVQTIVVKDDIAPVPDRERLPTIRRQCSATVTTIPTATDRCGGTIQGTTSDPLTYNTQGVHIITWTYDDGKGNVVTQTQRVIIRDRQAPVPDQANLPTLTGSCSVMVTHFPTATDNCAGRVTATTDSPLEFDQEGTYAILWNYDDGNGNTNIQTQWVIVDNNAAPNALCKNISMPMTGNGLVSISAADIDNGSFDDCSLVTLLISPAGGSIFGTALPPASSMDLYCKDGKEQNLLLSVTNEKGNTAHCQAKVTLQGTDTDNDGILDSCDNCPDTYNPDQKDSNNDGQGDACEENSNPDPYPGGWGGWSLKKQGQEENKLITELKAFPNPFQEEVNLSFNLSQEEKTTVEIFNIQGQRVHTLLSELAPKGEHRVLWDGKDQNGQPLPSGIYLIRLRAGKALINQKVMLQR